MELLDGGSISLWTVVGAVQALERSVAAHASRLLSLEHRAGNAEKKDLEHEKVMGELGNQLESKWTALGNLVREYGQLQRRLENMENLLKNRNFWVLRLPPGGEVPKAPTLVLENDTTGFSAQEWENLEEWQRELCRKVLAGKSQTLVLPGPDGAGHNAQAPAGGGDRERSGDPAENGSEDSIIQIKQEEELCTAVQEEEEEAGEAPGEPCPAEQTFCDPEASSQTRKGNEVDARELPGAEDEDIPRHPDTGFQTYAMGVSSWIKQEEEPRCPEQQHLEKEEISADPSTDENTKRDPPAECFESTTCDSEAPGRPGERFPKDPSPGVTWDSQWNSEMMETNSTGNGYDRGFGEHLDFFSAQEKRPCVSKCERNSPQQDQPQAPQGQGEMFPGPTCERVFPLLHPQLGEKGMGPGAAPAPCQGGQTPAGTARLWDQDLGGEEPAENEENFPMDTSGACWDPPPARGSPAHQQQSQGRGKSYICSDCGKSFVCHSWLVRHQTTHTGERPYKCSECDKTYRRKDYLLNHQRRHTGEGLFQCPLCRKRFVLRRSLVKHQESHVQEAHLPLAGWPCTDIRGSVMHSI
ncbi:PREDICTED: zinc finger protein 212-like isoform X3 [Lepidothrix coronata]|uniref:Zinc finger protein 212-like isoform X3 n=1 Tax=Lepidothrix coronata TaxID=321398 RepID=A0A6J0IZZ3_9PASS|nr:PREDICTED: zinc finger protein 212-like isoform X3 [Lepidothrix coronata]